MPAILGEQSLVSSYLNSLPGQSNTFFSKLSSLSLTTPHDNEAFLRDTLTSYSTSLPKIHTVFINTHSNRIQRRWGLISRRSQKCVVKPSIICGARHSLKNVHLEVNKKGFMLSEVRHQRTAADNTPSCHHDRRNHIKDISRRLLWEGERGHCILKRTDTLRSYSLNNTSHALLFRHTEWQLMW